MFVASYNLQVKNTLIATHFCRVPGGGYPDSFFVSGDSAWAVEKTMDLNIPTDPADMPTSFRCWPHTQRGRRYSRTGAAAANRARDPTPNQRARAVPIGTWSSALHIFARRCAAQGDISRLRLHPYAIHCPKRNQQTWIFRAQ
jgi:hypothetical protein